MFFKDKVLTYNPKDYEKDFSEDQKKDLRETSNFRIQKTSYKNTITPANNSFNKKFCCIAWIFKNNNVVSLWCA